MGSNLHSVLLRLPSAVLDRVLLVSVKSASQADSVQALEALASAAAQEVCDRLVSAGVTSVLNFAPLVLNVPDGVMVRKVDLSTELQILAFHEQRRIAAGLAVDPTGVA